MPERPNILLILTDQHRLSAAGCYGPTPCRTPHLDQLAREGLRFETAYTCCPVCSPARASFMTGLYPHSHGICGNVHNLGCSVHELPDSPQLLSRALGQAGYRCGYTGKWHLGTDQTRTYFDSPNEPSLPTLRGFEGQDFPGHGNGGHATPQYTAWMQRHGFTHRVTPPPGPCVMPCGILDGPPESTVEHFLADHTMALIDQFAAARQPFFIWHNFWGPHAPYFVARDYYEMYRGADIPRWPDADWPCATTHLPARIKLHPHHATLTWDDWAEAIRYYYAFATQIDDQTGRILAHLERRGLADNTLVVFAADHGETLGSHGGLTDKGWHHFEEIQRIPLVMRLPAALRGAHAPGAVLSDWASLLDLYPTFREIAGTPADPARVHGRSLVPLLRGEQTAWRDSIFVEFFGVNNLATAMITCRHGNLKYGWNCSNQDELYDLARDPHELRNLIDEPAYAPVCEEMRARMEQFMRAHGFPGTGMFRQSRRSWYPNST